MAPHQVLKLVHLAYPFSLCRLADGCKNSSSQGTIGTRLSNDASPRGCIHAAPGVVGKRDYDSLISALRIGSCRMRFPVAAKIALVTAGAIGGVPGSPTPPSAA